MGRNIQRQRERGEERSEHSVGEQTVARRRQGIEGEEATAEQLRQLALAPREQQGGSSV